MANVQISSQSQYAQYEEEYYVSGIGIRQLFLPKALAIVLGLDIFAFLIPIGMLSNTM